MKAKKKRPLGRPPLREKKKPTNVIILQAATELFLTNGFQDVSIDDVASKCNVTKATVYYYFESKAALFTEAMVQMMLFICDHMEAMLSVNEPLKNRLYNVAEAHLQATFNIDLEGFVRETKNSLNKKQLQQMQDSEEKMFNLLEQAFIDAIKANEIPEVNTKFAVHSYMAILKVGNYRNSDKTSLFPTVEETAENIINFFWNGLFQKQDE
ncbi:TetR/AcrR family transcriptional regulator [Bacillus pinisoli]|uniref:TetR/AcrR family transcriptional regulator n=1 Tax=Bacillus pinisoli TaxID=2901866 RepID=UPI001FF40EC3|nr:TetR/AcrR family transcriptional regulator [Bacillus pinisoli]